MRRVVVAVLECANIVFESGATLYLNLVSDTVLFDLIPVQHASSVLMNI